MISLACRPARPLSFGVRAGYLCAVLLCAAVALTWYGPGKDDPRIQVRFDGGASCGDVIGVDAGTLRLKTSDGEVKIDLTRVTALKPVEVCGPDTATP